MTTHSNATAWIGTSGWSYEHWQDVFYPKGLPKARRYEFFCGQFRTVELNATFYRLFPEKTFVGWREKAPAGFLYAVKLWRWITHRKRLLDARDDLRTFLERMALLGDTLGPLLVQLPPSFKYDPERVDSFLADLGRLREELGVPRRVTVEFRHDSWLREEAYELLRRHDAAFCIADPRGQPFPRVLTADWTYVRFHGGGVHDGLYDEDCIREWGQWFTSQLENGGDIYAYFNNDVHGHAITNARQLCQSIPAEYQPPPPEEPAQDLF